MTTRSLTVQIAALLVAAVVVQAWDDSSRYIFPSSKKLNRREPSGLETDVDDRVMNAHVQSLGPDRALDAPINTDYAFEGVNSDNLKEDISSLASPVKPTKPKTLLSNSFPSVNSNIPSNPRNPSVTQKKIHDIGFQKKANLVTNAPSKVRPLLPTNKYGSTSLSKPSSKFGGSSSKFRGSSSKFGGSSSKFGSGSRFGGGSRFGSGSKVSSGSRFGSRPSSSRFGGRRPIGIPAYRFRGFGRRELEDDEEAESGFQSQSQRRDTGMQSNTAADIDEIDGDNHESFGDGEADVFNSDNDNTNNPDKVDVRRSEEFETDDDDDDLDDDDDEY